MRFITQPSTAAAVALLCISAAFVASIVVSAWRFWPIATGLAFFFFVVGGAFAVRHPKNIGAHSVSLGAILGVFLGSAIALVWCLHANA